MLKEKQKKVLLVDDEEGIRNIISRLLAQNDYTVSVAADASAALDILSNEIFDLVVTDVKMPGEFSGIDLLKIIRAGFDTPVIVISGCGTLEVALSAMRHGAMDFVPKPINHEYLLNLAKMALEAPAGKEPGDQLGDMKFVVKFELDSTGPAPMTLREFIMGISPSIGLSDVRGASLWLCMKEALKNGAVHGNRSDPNKSLTLIIRNTPREVEVVVADQGDGFPLQEASSKVENAERYYLRGLNLIHNLADDVKFNEKGNEIKFVFLK